jgi:hypothetical protein
MLTTDYIVGLVDGEGSFSVRIPNAKRRAKVELTFSLKLRHQDKDILEELKQFFGCGNIYIQRDKRKNHSLCYRFEVHNKKEVIDKIIPFFENNPPKIQSRKRDFELFKEIAQLSQQDNPNLEKICSLKEQLHWGLAVYGKTVCTVGNQVTQQ